MTAERRSAIWVGVLWISATVFPAASAVPWNTLTHDRGILVNAATHKGELIAWLLLNVVEVLTAAGVAVMLYPILARVTDTSVQKGMALWYFGSRIAESGIYVVAIVATWAFLPLSLSLLWTGNPNSTLANVCFAPMGLQEMVLAVWLILKGFDAAALSKRSGAAEGALDIATR